MPRRTQPDSPIGFPRQPRLPRLQRLPIWTKGPRELRRVLASNPQERVWPPIPGTPHASDTERAVWWALTVPLKKVPDVDFSYQDPALGGRLQFGGTVLDFVMLDGSDIAMNPIGRYYHLEQGAGRQAIDQAQRNALLGFGLRLIFLDERPVLSDPLYLVQQALLGRDLSEISRGAV